MTNAMNAERTRRLDSAIVDLTGWKGGDGLIDQLDENVRSHQATNRTQEQAEALSTVTLSAWNLLVCATNEPLDNVLTASEALTELANVTDSQVNAGTLDELPLLVRTLQVESLLRTVQAALDLSVADLES
jgi:hypothetical protein